MLIPLHQQSIMLHDKMQRLSERIFTFKFLRTQTIDLRVYIFATDIVAKERLELSRLAARVSKTRVSTNSTTWPYSYGECRTRTYKARGPAHQQCAALPIRLTLHESLISNSPKKLSRYVFRIDRVYQFRHFPLYRERWIRTTTSLKIIVSISIQCIAVCIFKSIPDSRFSTGQDVYQLPILSVDFLQGTNSILVNLLIVYDFFRAERGTRTHEEFPPQFCRLCPLPLGFTSAYK